MWLNQLSFEKWRKHKKDTEDKSYSKCRGVEEDVNGDNFPEFVVRDDKGFIQLSDGIRITIPNKRQRVTKYFSENPTKQQRQEKHYKQQKEEDKPADRYRYFIKKIFIPLLERAWLYRSLSIFSHWRQSGQRDNQMMRLIQVGYTGFWNGNLGDISDDANDDGDDIFTIPSEKDIKEAKLRRDAKRRQEQEQYNNAMAKIKARKKPTFSDGKTVESTRLVPYDFQNDLDDYVIEDQ
ncbi:MAG: hypothetical protein EZS28_016280 [Streblomastix strix]|uniref:Uncharacterized protein n=1 Tax=Streblomastix strix TaxID=222440 RepID=A0A5J4W082_9EUKA|nr:MAG: hypothetical protein EZS28_016280 [Streblomastix strix]